MRKLVVTDYNDKILQTILEDGKITDFNLSDTQSVLGNIYIGKVENIVKNIHACFVDYGDKLPCYFSLDDNDIIYADGLVHNSLKVGDEIVVQISRAAVKTKNPVGSSELTLRGDYAIVHTGRAIGVSNKISDKQKRDELKRLAREILPDNMGCIIRTNAGDADPFLVRKELTELSGRLSQILKNAPHRKCFSCLYRAPEDYLDNITVIGSNRIDEIVCDHKDIYEDIVEYCGKKSISDITVTLYEDDSLPLSSLYNISKEMENATKERVWLKSGAYLVIQQTEALVTVDVNTGKAVTGSDMSAHLLKVNTEAAVETCRQLRLRNLSGIIIIDFINMKNPNDIFTIRDVLTAELAKDPVPAKFVDITRLGLVELTRKKLQKPLAEML
ncbi:MAG: ribonuclease E/G [Coprococcus sp.]|nr:ribonuclease E/G [Coprococcus sp.]